MKRNWLLYLVIFSLALNLGTIGALVYIRYQDRQAGPRDLARPLSLGKVIRTLQVTPDQRQTLEQLLPAHRRQVGEFQKQIARQRQELFLLLQEEEPALEVLDSKIRGISGLQAGMEKEMVGFFLQVRQNLAPDQRRILQDHLNQRFCSRLTLLGHPVRPEELCPPPHRRGPGRDPGGPPGPPPPGPVD